MLLTHIFKSQSLTYIKKGFWISLGASVGVVFVFAIINGSQLFVYKFDKNMQSAPTFALDIWENVSLSKEHKEFKNCFNKEKNEMKEIFSEWKVEKKHIPFLLTKVCKQKGLIPFGRYLEYLKIGK